MLATILKFQSYVQRRPGSGAAHGLRPFALTASEAASVGRSDTSGCPHRSASVPRVSHFHIRCPNCGVRPASEFAYGGEVRPAADPALTEREEVERLWLRRNVTGPQRERWFHTAGCRRYLTLTRDTRDNRILVEAGATDDRTGGETTTSAGELRPPS